MYHSENEWIYHANFAWYVEMSSSGDINSMSCHLTAFGLINQLLYVTTIHYRDYKYFDLEAFINDTKDANLGAMVSLSDDTNSVFSAFCVHFKYMLDLHAPLKWKTLRANQHHLCLRTYQRQS